MHLCVALILFGIGTFQCFASSFVQKGYQIQLPVVVHDWKWLSYSVLLYM